MYGPVQVNKNIPVDIETEPKPSRTLFGRFLIQFIGEISKMVNISKSSA